MALSTELQTSEQEPTTLYDLFRASAKTYGSLAALWVDGCSFSYTELNESAMRLASAIIDAGRNVQGGRCALLVDLTSTRT